MAIRVSMVAEKTLARMLLIVLFCGLLVSGCASAPQRAAPSGTLRWSLEGITDIVRLDPARPADSQTNIALGLIFGGLVRLDSNLAVEGDIAERWQVSADGTVYTFKLRQNAAFGDGSPVTAEAVVASFTRTLDPDTGQAFAPEFLKGIVGATALGRGETQTLDGMRAVDQHTLEVRLRSPQAYFLSQLTYALAYIVPPGILATANEEWKSKAFGSGPFRVQRYEPGKLMVLEPNPFYWRGPLGLASVEFSFYPDSGSAVDEYLAGKLDIMGSIQSGIPASKLAAVSGAPGLQTISAPAVRYIGFNNSRAPFNNVFVRQAFASAVEKSLIANQVLTGTVNVAERILPPDLPGADLPLQSITLDPIGARSIFAQAGYISGNSLPPIALTYANEADLDAVARSLQANWRDTLGVNVRLDPVPLETFIDRLDAMVTTPETGMDVYLSVWGMDYPDPHNFLSLQLHSGSPYNNGHWDSAEFDRLTDAADKLSDPDRVGERLKLYNQAEQIAVGEVGWLPLYYPKASVLIRPSVRGLVFTSVGIIAPDWTAVAVVPES